MQGQFMVSLHIEHHLSEIDHNVQHKATFSIAQNNGEVELSFWNNGASRKEKQINFIAY